MFLSPELPTVGATKDTWVHFHFQICYLLRLIHVIKKKVYIKLIRNSVSTSFTIFFIKSIISVIRWNFNVLLCIYIMRLVNVVLIVVEFGADFYISHS